MESRPLITLALWSVFSASLVANHGACAEPERLAHAAGGASARLESLRAAVESLPASFPSRYPGEVFLRQLAQLRTRWDAGRSGPELDDALKKAQRKMLVDLNRDKRSAGAMRSLTVWSRDCLEVELQLAGGQSLWVLANHFKSKMGGDPPAAREKRLAQGQRLAEILETRCDLARDYVVVMGDLNDVPDSVPIASLYALGQLHDVFDLADIPADDRWTYYYGNAPAAQRRTQIDYVFVSKALKNAVSNVRVHRRGMSAVAEGKIEGITPFDGITSWKNAASDHAAISVDLEGCSLTG